MKTIDEKFDLAARIDYGVKAGVRDAILEHKRVGVAIVVLENGKIVEIPPEKIEVNDNLPPSPL
jgi:hypothetical protein